MEMCNMARITELKNEGQKSKSPLKKVKFDTEEKNNYSSKKINESKYHLKEDEPEQIESLLASSQGISSLENNDPLLHLKFENTHSSNMEASTIKVQPVQKKGLKPKQLVKSVSNKYGKNALKDINQSSEDLYEGMQVFSIGIMDFTQQDFHEMMTRREGSPYNSSSPLTPLDGEEPFTLGNLLHDEYFNMGEINPEKYPIPQEVLQPGIQQSFDVDPELTTSNILIPEFMSGSKKEHSDNKNYIQTFSPSINSLIQEIQSNCSLPTNKHVKDTNETSLVKDDVMFTENFEEPLPTLEQLVFGEYFNNDKNPNKNLDTPQLQNLSLESPTFDNSQNIPGQNNSPGDICSLEYEDLSHIYSLIRDTQ
ncbi:hypothetical protein O181_103848 [Austropuccinia psidii MF-1]|uniref:Uncharacterized protein n=1 Tax=Austropuccinia psidii MF-1 TaxID=1389203 RepID=A0A9Q3JL36_9BASI|nr:hypothetical protein [Austropuccinia psidii MF-1]